MDKLSLVLGNTVILGSESRGFMIIFYRLTTVGDRQQDDVIGLFLFFQNKEAKLKWNLRERGRGDLAPWNWLVIIFIKIYYNYYFAV
jgi:hypothetical protein